MSSRSVDFLLYRAATFFPTQSSAAFCTIHIISSVVKTGKLFFNYNTILSEKFAHCIASCSTQKLLCINYKIIYELLNHNHPKTAWKIQSSVEDDGIFTSTRNRNNVKLNLIAVAFLVIVIWWPIQFSSLTIIPLHWTHFSEQIMNSTVAPGGRAVSSWCEIVLKSIWNSRQKPHLHFAHNFLLWKWADPWIPNGNSHCYILWLWSSFSHIFKRTHFKRERNAKERKVSIFPHSLQLLLIIHQTPVVCGFSCSLREKERWKWNNNACISKVPTSSSLEFFFAIFIIIICTSLLLCKKNITHFQLRSEIFLLWENSPANVIKL